MTEIPRSRMADQASRLRRALALGALGVTLPALLIDRSVFYRNDVPLMVRASAFLFEITLTALALAPAALSNRRAATEKGDLWLRALLCLPIAIWLGLSWGLYYGTSQMLGVEAVTFALGNGAALGKHFLEFNPLLVLALPLGIVGSSLAAALFLARPVRPTRAQKELGLLAAWGLLLTLCWGARCLTLTSSMEIARNRTTGELEVGAERFERYARREAGPLTALLASEFADWTGTSKRWPAPRLALPVHERPKVSLASYLAAVPGDAKRWNVIVVLVESLRHDALTLLGGKRLVMPHLEALARRSLTLARAYANATHSSLADPSALSSQHPLRSGGARDYPEIIPYPRVLLWDLLAPRGYRTAIVSSQNEHWAGMLNFLRTPALGRLFHAETYHQTYMPTGDAGFAGWAKRFEASGKVDDRDTIDELIRLVESPGAPFAVYTNLQNSHFPYRFPAEGAPFEPHTADFAFTFASVPEDKRFIIENRYHDALHYVDAQLGRLFDALERKGLWDETIVVVTGDTGQAFFEHGVGGHGSTPYDELIHVPLVVHAPGLEATVSTRVSQQLDILPTIFALLGMPPHPAFAGRSVVPGHSAEVPVFSIVQVPNLNEIAVIDGRLKLIVGGDGRRELYDLQQDPREETNLWSARGEDGKRLENLVGSFRAQQLAYYENPERFAREFPPSLFP